MRILPGVGVTTSRLWTSCFAKNAVLSMLRCQLSMFAYLSARLHFVHTNIWCNPLVISLHMAFYELMSLQSVKYISPVYPMVFLP